MKVSTLFVPAWINRRTYLSWKLNSVYNLYTILFFFFFLEAVNQVQALGDCFRQEEKKKNIYDSVVMFLYTILCSHREYPALFFLTQELWQTMFLAHRHSARSFASYFFFLRTELPEPPWLHPRLICSFL